MPSLYIPRKPRLWDSKHIESYLKEIDACPWAETSGQFPTLRLTFREFKKDRNWMGKRDFNEQRSLRKDIKRETAILKQYVRRKDYEERLEQDAQRTFQAEKERAEKAQSTENIILSQPTKQVLALLWKHIDERFDKIERQIQDNSTLKEK